MDIKDLSFINDLISTYSFYKENKLNDNDKIRDSRYRSTELYITLDKEIEI